MKVICINAGNIKPCNRCGNPETILIEGGCYHAEQDNRSPSSYDIQEELSCPKCGLPCSYKKSRFIPLSNIDETELVNKREETLASL